MWLTAASQPRCPHCRSAKWRCLDVVAVHIAPWDRSVNHKGLLSPKYEKWAREVAPQLVREGKLECNPYRNKLEAEEAQSPLCPYGKWKREVEEEKKLFERELDTINRIMAEIPPPKNKKKKCR